MLGGGDVRQLGRGTKAMKVNKSRRESTLHVANESSNHVLIEITSQSYLKLRSDIESKFNIFL